MQPVATPTVSTRRGLLIHDGIAFLVLLAVSLILLGITLFLFKSFEAHRDELGKRWSDRGRLALERGHPEEAVGALHTALTYAPDDRADQLLLAQALAGAGHTEEANNYFQNLWETRPGDGFINLQLARLARARGQDRAAEDYYRASVYGSWEGDGIVRRREVRLELADFLIGQHQNAEARNELFTVAGNAPANVDLNLKVARRLEAAGYLPDALSFYRKAVALDPHSRPALAAAGQAAYALASYPLAEKYLQRALDAKATASPGALTDQSALSALAQNARRIQQLSLNPDQPVHQRASHILAAANIAQTRLGACLSPASPKLADLTARWAALLPSRRTLTNDADAQDRWTGLIFETEMQAAQPSVVQTCGVPAGDDALLLRLANTAQKEAASGS